MTVENRGSINNTDREEYFYQNPILHADYSDPDVIRDGDDFYMVASSFYIFTGSSVVTFQRFGTLGINQLLCGTASFFSI